VVEYALSRSLSPALVAEYQTRLPDKSCSQAKLHEFYALSEEEPNEANEESYSRCRYRSPRINDASQYDKMPGIGPHPQRDSPLVARLPLPVARAVLFASTVDDPGEHPEKMADGGCPEG